MDQIRLWEAETMRVRYTPGQLYENFESLELFTESLSFARSQGTLLWAGPPSSRMFVARESGERSGRTISRFWASGWGRRHDNALLGSSAAAAFTTGRVDRCRPIGWVRAVLRPRRPNLAPACHAPPRPAVPAGHDEIKSFIRSMKQELERHAHESYDVS